MLKSYCKGESSNKTPKNGSCNTDRQTEPIEEIEPNSSKNYINYMDAGKPKSYEKAIATSDPDTGRQAMKSEMDSIHQNQTWELIKLLAKRKSLPYK